MNLRCEAGGIISKEEKEPETGPMYLTLAQSNLTITISWYLLKNSDLTFTAASTNFELRDSKSNQNIRGSRAHIKWGIRS